MENIQIENKISNIFISLKDNEAFRFAIFEAKYTRKLENLASDCDRARVRIDDQMYVSTIYNKKKLIQMKEI